MIIDGKHYALSMAYCERCPSREMVEHAGEEWTSEHQAEWDRHQARYEQHLRAIGHMGTFAYDAEMEEYIEKHRGHEWIGGLLVHCLPSNLLGVDKYGGKVRGGSLLGDGPKLQVCLCCSAVTRQWPIPDEEPKKP